MSTIIEKQNQKLLLKIKKPSMYNVIFHNDDVTTFEFVILILIKIFNKNPETALKITKQIHEEGKSIVAQYNHEIALSKKQLTDAISAKNNFPLNCEIQPVEN